MMKKVLAYICILAMLISMYVMPASAVETENQPYKVGYAKRDINPWIALELADGTVIGIEDKEYAPRVDSQGNPALGPDGNPAQDIVTTKIHNPKNLEEVIEVKLVSVPLGGYGNTDERHATCLTDDNGDGYISYGDGMYITCTTVTDSYGKTVIYVTVDVTSVGSDTVEKMRTAIVRKLGANVVSEDEIMVTANHSHSGASFSAGTAGSAYEAYYYYMIDQVAEAAKEAYNTKSEATMSKGSIESSDGMKELGYVDEKGNGLVMNYVRHTYSLGDFQYATYSEKTGKWSGWNHYHYYKDKVTNKQVDLRVELIRTAHSGGTCFPTPDGDVKYKSYTDFEYDKGSVSEVDDTMHILRFDRKDADPVLMINWRGHSTRNGGGGSNKNISGDYANSLRYRLENNKTLFGGDTNYCVAFWQGASGNVNTGGHGDLWYAENPKDNTHEEVKVKWAELGKDADGNATVTVSDDAFYHEYYNSNSLKNYNNRFYYCAKYGFLLAKIAMICMDSPMEQCETGKILTKQSFTQLDRNQYTYGQYLAAKQWDEAGRPDGNKVFPYWFDTDLDGDGILERYILNSKFHANSVLNRYSYCDPDLDGKNLIPVEEQSKHAMEINAIKMGNNVSIVTIPGEPFDRYSDEYIEASATGNKTWKELIPVAASDNDWDDLITEDYGTPFVLGYSNAGTGYLPNALAYDYLKDLRVPLTSKSDTFNKDAYYKNYYNVYDPGSYESNTSRAARGSGEQVIAQLGDMLNNIEQGHLYYECPACGKVADWEPRTPQQLQTIWTAGHFYLTEDHVSAGNSYQHPIGESSGELRKTVCLDLNGKTWEHNGRILSIYKGSILNVMDSKGGGAIIAKSGSYNVGGGMMNINSGGTLNLYSGKLAFERDEEYLLKNNRPYRETNRGGVISCSSGTINVYGGTIQGGQMGFAYYDITESVGADGKIKPYSGRSGSAGAILLTGTAKLNVYGGEILAGKAAKNTTGLKLWYKTGETDELGNPIYEERLVPDGIGDCVLAEGSSTKVNLYGNAKVDEVYCYYNNGSKLNVSGDFTGKVNVQYDPTNAPLDLIQDVGSVVNSSAIMAGTLTCVNEDGYQFAACDGELMLFKNTVEAVMGATAYESVAEAIADHTDSTGFVKLLQDVDSVTIDKTVYMDLNGHNIGKVTAVNGGKLYCLDTQTDDYVIEGDAENGYSGYGAIRKFPEGAVAAVTVDDLQTMHSYAMIREAGKGISFHCVNLQLTHMSLKTKLDSKTEYNPSVYYTSAFSGDALVAANVGSFGVALSAVEEPNADNMGDTNRFSRFDGAQFNADKTGSDAASTLLYGIMKESNTDQTNQENASKPVYGRAYVQLKDGQYVFGYSACRTLKEQIEAVDDNWKAYTSKQRQTVVAMYQVYSDVLAAWDIPNIKKEAG